jgi:queuine tRNA-ribosyltransferase catalytic subunit
MARIRDAIKQDQFVEFVRDFFRVLYHGEQVQYPKWAVDALNTVGINILEETQIAGQK